MELTQKEVVDIMGYVVMFILGLAVGFTIYINMD